MICKNCGKTVEEGFNNCPFCGDNVYGQKKQKKPIFKKWWFWLIIIIVIISIGSAVGTSDTEPESERETVDIVDTTASVTEKDNVYKVGEVFNSNGLKIKFIDSGVWTGYNEYLAPEQGNVIVRYYFEVENTSDGDRSVSTYEFEAYADGKAVEKRYFDDDISLTLSSGRSGSGYVYFEVPADTEIVEAEYEFDWWDDGKVIFLTELN